jgi:CelD/BcsL family acetyltransferase involved in cellulose biosynthesis
MNTTIKIITKICEFNDLKTQWNDLLGYSKGTSFFLKFEWLNLWWHHYSSQDDILQIFTVTINNDLIAIAPFYKHKNILYALGTNNNYSDEVCTEYTDIICKTGFEKYILQCIEAQFTKYLHSNIEIKIVNYLEGSLLSNVLLKLKQKNFVNIEQTGSRYQCQLPYNIEKYRASLPSSFTKKMKRHSNKFINELGGTIEKVRVEGEVEKYLDTLKILHQNRWQLKNKAGAFTSERFMNFHISFCKHLIQNKNLQLWTLKVKEEVISAIYCIDFNDTRYFYQSGTNMLFKPNISPGNLLHLLVIEDSISLGLKHYDFMKGDTLSSYKQKFTNSKVNMYNAQIIRKSFKNSPKILYRQLNKLR